MAFLNSKDKTGSDPETRDKISSKILEFKKPGPGTWLFPKNPETCCVYRVPNSIRKVNPEAYTPQLIILGPLHHSLKFQALKYCGDITNTKLMGYLNMEQHRKIYLAEFAGRFEEEEQTIDGLRRIIEEEENLISASYSESTAWIESQQFVDMILHDSVFIMEFFLRTYYARSEKTGDALMDEPCLESTVKDDLVLLENQLPYFILEKLFDPIVPRLLPNHTFRKFVITHFLFKGKIRDSSKFRHFTDLVRLVHVETLPELGRGKRNPIEHMYNAEKLYNGGVKFEALDEGFSMNVRFKKGCLKMPCLRIEDKVEMRLINVMALEQCHYPFNAHVCNYVIFLYYLIDTHKDVELLVEKGIIKNWIGQDNLVADMVNKLGLGIVLFGSYYIDIAAEVNAYYTNPIHRSGALLIRVYFGDLWTSTVTVAAMFLLLMTLIQAVASIIQVMQ